MNSKHEEEDYYKPVRVGKFGVTMTVCFYHDTYTFQSEFKLYSCLNVKELPARNRRDIWSLSGYNRIWTYNHLVRKWTRNRWVFVYELSGCEFESRFNHLINPVKRKDNKYFQYTITVVLSYGEIKSDPQRITKIKPFIDKYNWKE